jgi:hypothetical protein
MVHYLVASDGKTWRWTDEPYPGRLEPVPGLPPGETISGRLIDHQTCFEIRLDSTRKMPEVNKCER